MLYYFYWYLAGCATMGAVWFFWPSEKAALRAEIGILRVRIAAAEAKLKSKVQSSL